MAGYYLRAHLTLILFFDTHLHHGSSLYANAQARYYLHLYGAGVLGGTLYTSYFYARDANQRICSGIKLPTLFDCLGYLIHILGSRIKDLVFYFLIIGSVIVVSTSGSESELKPIIADLLAFAGGYSTGGVKSFISRWFLKLSGGEFQKVK